MTARTRIGSTLATLLAAALPAAASAQIITFDDIAAGGYHQLGTNYQGLNWNNSFVMEAATGGGSFAPVAAASSPNVIFPGFGNPSGFVRATPGTFTLHSIDFIQWAPFGGPAAPSSTVRGYLFGAPVAGDEMVVLLGPTYTTATFDWSGIDEVRITQENGAGWYVADNVAVSGIAVTATPEPASLALVAGGLVGLAAVRRRRRG